MSTSIQRHRRYGREQWQRLILEQQQSGLSQQAFCQSRGLALSTFQNWKRRLGPTVATTRAEPADWVELPPSMALTGGSGWDIELDFGGGVCLRLRRA